ncbi:porphobilinogen synthase [Methanospirillum stamsii]|uniref:Delta-aminolevulinic acid dehydratase n=1 Tax=Methanospirillum stamsii TaxID=1277351 RepID=A0A2V2N6S2_9EURY|nr:porphobilinogen synthase [Methanospirillum stamsii]PWR71221.1 porphobilinogen synthase [Methanospirillum stamsii]
MFPQVRLRRLRRRKIIPLLEETRISNHDLIAPLFFDEGAEEAVPIQAMPGQFRWPVRKAGDVVTRLYNAGIRAVLLFGIPKEKDAEGSGAFASDGVVQQVTREMKSICPDMVIITDLCACEYTDHGHCGVIGESCDGPCLLNDPSLEMMQRIAVSQAEAGADIVAPSCMLDGMVSSIREALDDYGHQDVLIMSYSSKFASSLYGPFREAAGSGYSFGDRTGYQAPVPNRREAYRESELDAAEGADILMVKPAGWFGDIITDIKQLGLPVAAYQVSGEYSMIRAAAQNGWLDEKRVVIESLISLKRAGADLIITYFAEEVCRWIHEQ